MKKTLSCIAVSLLSVLPAAAFQEQMVENAVLRAQALQQRRSDAREKERFKNYLGLAIIKMDEEMLNWNYLGPALYKSVSAVMAAKKADKTLTEDEKRAIYYAVYELVPKAYQGNMDNVKGYDSRYSFNPKDKTTAFFTVYEDASVLVYRAVQEIGMTQTGYKTWLGYLNDALVPGYHKSRYASAEAREKERFINYLGLAKIAMEERRLNTNYLGPALYKSVSAVMAAKKADKTLTEDEKRAIYYAVYDLVPGAYRRNMDSKEQYDKRFRFNPENEPDNSAYSNASMLVYQAVREIGTTDSACEKWLWYLDDALVPASR